MVWAVVLFPEERCIQSAPAYAGAPHRRAAVGLDESGCDLPCPTIIFNHSVAALIQQRVQAKNAHSFGLRGKSDGSRTQREDCCDQRIHRRDWTCNRLSNGGG